MLISSVASIWDVSWFSENIDEGEASPKLFELLTTPEVRKLPECVVMITGSTSTLGQTIIKRNLDKEKIENEYDVNVKRYHKEKQKERDDKKKERIENGDPIDEIEEEYNQQAEEDASNIDNTITPLEDMIKEKVE